MALSNEDEQCDEFKFVVKEPDYNEFQILKSFSKHNQSSLINNQVSHFFLPVVHVCVIY